MDTVSSLLPMLLSRLPHLLLWLVAGVMAALRWHRHPTASLLLVIGASLEVMMQVGSTALTAVMMGSHDGTARSFQGLLLGGISLVGVLAMGCVVAAVFAERPRDNPS